MITTEAEQDRRKEERRKEARALVIALKQIIAAASSSSSADDFMNYFLALSAKAIGCSSALIVFRDDAVLRSKYHYAMREALDRSWTSEELPHAVLAEITRTQVIIEDTMTDERVNRTVMNAYKIRSALAIPFAAGNRIPGILLFHSSSPSSFTHEHVEFATSAGLIAAIAFDDRQARDKAGQQESRLEEVTRLSDSANRTNMIIHSLRRSREIMQRVIAEGTQAVKAESGMIFMEEDGLWRVDYVYNLPQDLVGRKYKREEVIHTAIAAETVEPVLITDVDHDPRIDKQFAKDLKIRALIDFPLIIRENAVGDIVFHYHTTTVRFSDLSLDYVAKLALAVSSAINNAYLFDELSRSQERASFYEKAVQSSAQPFYSADPDGRVISFNRAFSELTGYGVDQLRTMTMVELTAPEWLEFEKKMAKLVSDTGKQQIYEKEYLQKDGSRVPVEIILNQVSDEKGNLQYYYAFVKDLTVRKKSEDDLKQAKKSLEENVRELEQRNHDIEMLSAMDSLLQASTNRDEAKAAMVKSLAQLFAPAPGALYLVEGTGGLLESAAAWGEALIKENVITSKDCWGLRLGRLYSIEDPVAETFCSHVSKELRTGYICVPIVAQNEMFGLLYLQYPPDWIGLATQGKKTILEYKKQLAITATESIALSLANFHLRDILYTQSIRDPLTDLFNRRYMREILEKELRRTIRRKRPLAVIMFDLDYFKQFNDKHGHEAGDILLRELADYVKTHVREDDIACRYGGEEFVIGLPETSLAEARERAERLREGISHLTIQYLGKSLGPITISAGVAVLPEHGLSQDELLRAADTALYQAKKEGRNRVVAA